MLKKLCPYHKIPINHTLEQCDMLKKYYSRVSAKDNEAKKDGVTRELVVSPLWRHLPHLQGTNGGHVHQPVQA
jgi:hypothetical protein